MNKINKNFWQQLGEDVARFETLKARIENAKETIRNLTDNEIENEFVDVKRKSYTKTDLNAEDKKKLEEFKKTLSYTKTTIENYTIELHAKDKAKTKVQLIDNNIGNKNITTIRKTIKAMKLVSKV